MLCPKCGSENTDGSKFCSNCSAPLQGEAVTTKLKNPLYKKWWFWVVAAIIIIAIIGGNSGDNNNEPNDEVNAPNADVEQNNSKKHSEVSEAPSTPWEESGMYKAGTDIAAGEYFVLASGSCYVEVATDSTGDLNSILTNDNVNTFAFITIQDGQYLTVKNGKFVEAKNAEVPAPKDGVYSEGQYRIGTDIPAGEYKVEANSGAMAYLEVSSDSTGNLNNIISNNNFEGSKYISVSDGQYLTIKNGVIYEN